MGNHSVCSTACMPVSTSPGVFHRAAGVYYLPKRKAVRTTIELKKELIVKFESGTRVSAHNILFQLTSNSVVHLCISLVLHEFLMAL